MSDQFSTIGNTDIQLMHSSRILIITMKWNIAKAEREREREREREHVYVVIINKSLKIPKG